MADEPEQTTYVVTVARVRQAIDELLDRDTAPFFVGYLWLRREAGIRGTNAGLKPPWPELGERFLAVDGGPAGKPHLRPFWIGQRNAHQEWLNQNIAGSFAPSSLRQDAYSVVEVDAQRRFVLREQHWQPALTVLLKGQPLPAVAVAAFMLRDYGFVSDEPPTTDDLIAAFRKEFRYGPGDDDEFDTLFDSEWEAGTDWFEPIVTDGAHE